MKRFYKEVSVAPADGGWQVTLDGRGIKTQTGNQQFVPTRALAEAMFPGSLSRTTRQTIDWAESNEMAFALLMVSPEMLRR